MWKSTSTVFPNTKKGLIPFDKQKWWSIIKLDNNKIWDYGMIFIKEKLT